MKNIKNAGHVASIGSPIGSPMRPSTGCVSGLEDALDDVDGMAVVNLFEGVRTFSKVFESARSCSKVSEGPFLKVLIVVYMFL